MSTTNADGKRLSNVAFIFYSVLGSPSAIAKHFRLCMQFADSAGNVEAQSKELVRGPPELVQHFRLQGEFTSAQWRCITLIDEVWLKSLAYPSGEEGGKFHVQIISTCLRYVERKGGGYPRRVC